MFDCFCRYASIDGNFVFNSSEINKFLSETTVGDKNLKELGISEEDINDFIKHVYETFIQKETLADSNTETAKERTTQLQTFVEKFNLYNRNQENTELLNDAKNTVNEYINEFGELISTSRCGVLNIKHSGEEIQCYDRLRNNHKFPNDPEAAIQEEMALVKETRFANCGEAADLTGYILHKNFADKYEVSRIEFHCEWDIDSHVAILVKDKNSDESYVIDNWIEPNGGIFEKETWEKMIQSVYQVDEYKITTKKP